jgi:lysophospholipase L1-like esterase
MTRRALLALTLALASTRRLAARGQAAPAVADKWAAEIAAFAAADDTSPFPSGGVVFVGSSSIRLWDLAAAFPGRPVLNRGFGGTQILDSVRHVDRLVIRHKPAIVIFYAGDNDLAAGRTPQQVHADFATFVGQVHAALPATRIAFIGIKPSIARWALIAQVREANRLVRDSCDRDDRLGYVDVDAAMLGWDGKPRPELFVQDGLHMTAKGYEIWNMLVRPFLQ